MTLNLNLNNAKDSDIQYNFFFMPDGQPHIQLEPIPAGQVDVTCSLTSMNDVGKLLVATNAVTSMKVDLGILYTPYFLGARQDRKIKGEALTVKIIADLVNSMLWDEVLVLHPHSNSVGNLVENFTEIPHEGYLERAIDQFKPDFLIIPDAGAAKNAGKYRKYNLPMVQCLKVRNETTGKLSDFRCVDLVPRGRGLIVDDILDGCGTFLGLSKLFPDNELGLYGTHGIFSNAANFPALELAFSQIFCTNSYLNDRTVNLSNLNLMHV